MTRFTLLAIFALLSIFAGFSAGFSVDGDLQAGDRSLLSRKREDDRCKRKIDHCRTCLDRNSCRNCDNGFLNWEAKECLPCSDGGTKNCKVCQPVHGARGDKRVGECTQCRAGYALVKDRDGDVFCVLPGEIPKGRGGKCGPGCDRCDEKRNEPYAEPQCTRCEDGTFPFNGRCFECAQRRCKVCQPPQIYEYDFKTKSFPKPVCT